MGKTLRTLGKVGLAGLTVITLDSCSTSDDGSGSGGGNVDKAPITATTATVNQSVLTITNTNSDPDGDNTSTNIQIINNDTNEVVANETFTSGSFNQQYTPGPGDYVIETITTANGKTADDFDSADIEPDPDSVTISSPEVTVNAASVVDGAPAGTEVGSIDFELSLNGEVMTVAQLEAAGFIVDVESSNDLLLVDSDLKMFSTPNQLERENANGEDVLTELNSDITITISDSEGNTLTSETANYSTPIIEVDDFAGENGAVIEIDGHQEKHDTIVADADDIEGNISGNDSFAIVNNIQQHSSRLGIVEDAALPGVHYMTFDRDNNGTFFQINPDDIGRLMLTISLARNDDDTENGTQKILNNTGDINQLIAQFLTDGTTVYNEVTLQDGSIGLDIDNEDLVRDAIESTYEHYRNQGDTPAN